MNDDADNNGEHDTRAEIWMWQSEDILHCIVETMLTIVLNKTWLAASDVTRRMVYGMFWFGR